MVIKTTRPTVGGHTLNYVACPTCQGKDKKKGESQNHEDKRGGARLPVKKEPQKVTPHWLDDYV